MVFKSFLRGLLKNKVKKLKLLLLFKTSHTKRLPLMGKIKPSPRTLHLKSGRMRRKHVMFVDEMDMMTMNAISSKIHQTSIQMQIPLVLHGKTVT